MGLSLLKSGTHPDTTGDRGVHLLRYALLPHNGGFSAVNVIRPAREFNAPLTLLPNSENIDGESSLLSIDSENIFLESIKKAEDGQGFILRLYEGENKRTKCGIHFPKRPKDVSLCNMLEENKSSIDIDGKSTIELNFKCFEIITLRVEW